MNSIELARLMLSDIQISRIFCGIFPRDKFKKVRVSKTPALFIVNTDLSGYPGEHWVAIFIGNNLRGEYFDSFGLPPRTHDVQHFLEKNTIHYFHNAKVLQYILSDTCGLFCFYYAKRKARGMSMNQALQNLRILRPHFNEKTILKK